MTGIDPRTFRRRVAVRFAILSPFVLAVFGFHLWDAQRRGETVWPVVLGVALVVALIGGTVFYATREGPDRVRARSVRLLKWVAPLALALAALRAVAWLAGWV